MKMSKNALFKIPDFITETDEICSKCNKKSIVLIKEPGRVTQNKKCCNCELISAQADAEIKRQKYINDNHSNLENHYKEKAENATTGRKTSKYDKGYRK